jgi:two-component system, OmpR family, osmolarity sensor histidine kinase EnvZ
MKWLPQSLLARSAIVLLFALIASQLASVALFRHYSREPRVQLLAIGFIGQLKTIRAALEIIPPNQQREFLQKLREERGMRVFRMREEEPMELAPDIPALRVIREKMREELGAEAEIFARTRPQKPDAPPLLITRLPVKDVMFYVVFPRSRLLEPDFTWAWVGWGVFGGALALAGALFLMWRVNKPLKALVKAAHDIGHGKNVEPITEMGPSEVKSVAVAFNQMRADLLRLDKERVTFLAGVSHDLRTPLSRLRLGLEMLPADEATRNDIEKDIEDINDVIEQFMVFARDESRETVEPIDLNLIVRAAMQSASRGNTQLTFSSELHDPLVITIRPHAIKRVVTNLLENAIKHAQTDIHVVTRMDADGNAILSVMDRGEGIAANDVERLKQPFTRKDNARSGASGAGLGLAIVERIIKIHGGTLQLLPRDGGGLEARVIFKKKN